ncbi:MAG: energy-coupling factor ABC transporter permease [Bryobacteraceae bacterium]|nr:energy-coupling factor ABC transporter permease [Bryobacteraceae bacterium]
MHIPDGYLSPPVLAVTGAAGLAGVVLASRRAAQSLDEPRVPLMGVMGAFVFAAQMINFPVAAGASGHLLGSALLAITLGTAPAIVVMTAILAVQALLFQDGGLLALGANALNMAVAGVAAAAWSYRVLDGGRRRRAAAFAAGTLSAFVAACLALAELASSGIRIPAPALAGALGVFAVTAVVEGAITAAVVAALERIQPSLLEQQQTSQPRLLAGVLLFSLLLAAAGFLLASALPDGLEHLAQRLGIEEMERALAGAPMPDYQAPWFSSPWLGKAVAGVAGLGAAAALCWAAGKWIARWRNA